MKDRLRSSLRRVRERSSFYDSRFRSTQNPEIESRIQNQYAEPESRLFFRFTKRLPSMQDIQTKITHILTEKLGIAESEITTDANFVKDLGIDSLDYAELVMDFEQTFDIKIPDDDAEKMQTIGQAVK